MLFHKPTQNIYDWITAQPNVKEESITDWLLFDLSKNCPRLKYYAFTRHEETSNGADWEWWILTYRYAYRFRVQAKKLKSTADNYHSVCYSNINGLQIDRLLNSALCDAAFPLYMFYSAVDQDFTQTITRYPASELIEMIKWCEPCRSGVFLSPAHFVYDEVLTKPRRRVGADTLVNISLKLSMFDWLLRQQDGQAISRVVENLLNELDRGYNRVKAQAHSFRYEYEKGTNRHQYRTVPNWLPYINGDNPQTKSGVPDWFEGEFRRELPHVAGVSILDLRQGDRHPRNGL